MSDPRDHFEQFFDHSIDLLCIADTAGYLRVVNPAWERALGWTAAELTGRPYIELVHPDDVAPTLEAAGALARGEKVLRFVNRYRCKGGGHRRLEWCSVIPDSSGLIFATVRDITEASRDAVHLAEIEVIAGVGSWEIDLDTGAVYWSRQAHAIHETDPSTFRPSLEEAICFFTPEAQAELRPAIERLITRGAPYDLELPLVTAGGRGRWVRATAAAETRGGRVTRAYGTVQDTTARRAAAEALARRGQEAIAAHHRLQATLAAIPDPLFELDDDGRFLSYHAGFSELLAAPPEEFLGRRLEEVLPPEIAAIGRSAMAVAAASGRASGQRYSIDLPGGPRWFELSAARRPAEDPQAPPGFVFLTRDVTARREAELRLQEERERAELASLAKSRFLANMSHEIRTPMNGILGMAELLARALPDPEHRQMLAVIRESGQHLLTILNDILDMSKIEAGKLEIERVAFQPAELVRKVGSLHDLKAGERGVTLEVRTSGGIDVPRVGDPHRILQILHNLVSNALKFTQRGSVVVSFECDPRRPLAVEVVDTGIGMSEEQTARIFEDFEQADTSVTRRFGGTGLGMSIVRHLVTLMGGTITVESRLGAGTRVRVELPLAVAAGGGDGARAAADAAAPARFDGLRVLGVDDNEINRLVLRKLLERLTARATVVASGAAAIAEVEGADFDVLLLDISMPEMDGIESLRAIRAVLAARGRPPIPAVAVTANAYEHQVAEYLAAGFDAHVAKPIRPDALRATLAAALRRADARAPAST